MSHEDAKPDLLACTKFLRFLMIPRLIDHTLKNLFEQNPICAREALNILVKTLTNNKDSYYKLVATETHQMVKGLMAEGFVNWSSGTLRFCVPLVKGGVFEFFPQGADIEVNPCNYEHFISLYKTYHRLVEVCTETALAAAYAAEVAPLLPVGAQSNLLCGNFSVILSLLRDHLLNASSIWSIATEKKWQRLRVTYAVPFRSRLFPVHPWAKPDEPVPFSKAHEYVEMAARKLLSLSQRAALGRPLEGGGGEEEAEPPARARAHRRPSRGDANPEWSGPDEGEGQRERVGESGDFPAFLRAQAELPRRTAATRAEALSRDTSLSWEERQFWVWVLRLWENPEAVVPGQIAFVLRLPHGDLPLKVNGEYIGVTPNNVLEFVGLIEQASETVHALFKGHLISPRPTDLPLGAELDNWKRFPVTDSQKWNQFTLTEKDIERAFFDQVRVLRERFETDDAKIEELKKYRFYIPTKLGIYDLIPNGRFISVNFQNAEEFFMRVEEEYYKLCSHELHIGGLEDDMGEHKSYRLQKPHEAGTLGSVRVCLVEKETSEVYRSCKLTECATKGQLSLKRRGSAETEESSHIGVKYANPVPHVTVPGAARASPDVRTTSDTRPAKVEEFLDERDLPFLTEFERHTMSMFSSNVNEMLVDSMNFRWSIVVPDRRSIIPLKPHGDSIPVKVEEFSEYLQVVINKIHQIRSDIVDCGRFPKHKTRGPYPDLIAVPAGATAPPAAVATDTTEHQAKPIPP